MLLCMWTLPVIYIALLDSGVQGFWLPHVLDTMNYRDYASRGGADEAKREMQ